MADGINTRTQGLTREQISAIVGRNPRAIRLLEDLLSDVSTTLPAAITDVELALRFSLQAADGSKAASFDGLRLAEEALTLMRIQRSLSTQVTALQREVEDLRAQLQMLATANRSTLAGLRAGLDEVRAHILTT